MKTSYIAGFLCMASLFVISSCKRPKSPEVVTQLPHADLSIKFNHKAGGASITQGSMNITHPAGYLYSVDMLKYYVTQVVLVREDGYEFRAGNYDLIDAFNADFSTVEAKSVPNGKYKFMRFNLGVDSARNHSGSQDGDLDPIHNMIWTWSTGYIFFKHEGSFKDAGGATQVMQYHLGTDYAFSSVQIPIDLTVSGQKKTMNLLFELNNMYNSPLIDFNVSSIHMSTSPSDKPWIDAMKANTADAFSFESVN